MLSGSVPDRLHHCAYVWYKEAKVSGYHSQREKRIRRGEGASPRERERVRINWIGSDQCGVTIGWWRGKKNKKNTTWTIRTPRNFGIFIIIWTSKTQIWSDPGDLMNFNAWNTMETISRHRELLKTTLLYTLLAFLLYLFNMFFLLWKQKALTSLWAPAEPLLNFVLARRRKGEKGERRVFKQMGSN